MLSPCLVGSEGVHVLALDGIHQGHLRSERVGGDLLIHRPVGQEFVGTPLRRCGWGGDRVAEIREPVHLDPLTGLDVLLERASDGVVAAA